MLTRGLEWVPVMNSQTKRNKVVVLFSGGLDSTTLISKYVKEGYEVLPISFDYGQTHSREMRSVSEICRHYGLSNRLVHIDMSVASSALLGNSPIPSRSLEEIQNGVPSTFVPARNLIFLSIGASYAYSAGARRIAIGVNSIDYSGYPDCRPEFISVMEAAIRKGLDSDIFLDAPLQYLSKREIIKKGTELGAPYNLTWSCYRGGEAACGRCDSCLLRLQGFMEAGIPDPVRYESYPDFYSTWMKENKEVL